jgi:hypothetical protein
MESGEIITTTILGQLSAPGGWGNLQEDEESRIKVSS